MILKGCDDFKNDDSSFLSAFSSECQDTLHYK